MKTVKYKGTEIHVGCEGTVIKGICVRCGERKPKRKLFGEGTWIERKPPFDAEGYKRRIRNMEDLK
jgi:hypothetical protein